MTREEKLRHWEETFRGMRLYPFMIHEPYAILQVADPGDMRALAGSIWQLGEKLKAYAVELLEESGTLKEAVRAASPAFPPQAPEYAQPEPPQAPSPPPGIPPSARRGRRSPAEVAGDLPPGMVEVAGAPPAYGFLQPPEPKSRSIA